jgi:hypothetical protein
VCVPRWERANKGLFTAGVVFVPLGFSMATAGAIMCGIDDCPNRISGDKDAKAMSIISPVLMATGGALLATGIVFLIIGAPKVPIEPGGADTALLPTLTIGPTGGSLSWRF